MSTPTAVFNLPSPSPTTKFKDLGAEILAWTNAVDALLASFDYDGADPNLVLSRVAQLETDLAPLLGRYEGGSHATLNSGVTLPSTAWTVLAASGNWTLGPSPMGAWANGIVAPRAGVYRVSGSLQVAANVQMLFVAKKNSTAGSMTGVIAGDQVAGFAFQTIANFSRDIRLAAGDVITPAVYMQSTGGPFGVTSGEPSSFAVEFVRA